MYDINSIISSAGEHGYLWYLFITILGVSVVNLLMVFVRAFIGIDNIILNHKQVKLATTPELYNVNIMVHCKF